MRFFCSLLFFISLSQISLSSQNRGPSLEQYSFTTQAMGTTWHLTFFCDDAELADTMADKCWSKLDSLNMILSDYDKDSELSQLSLTSGSGRWVQVSDAIWEILTFSDELSQESQGAFDITIGPLSKIWRRAIRRGEYPDEIHLSAAKAKVGFNLIDYDREEQAVRLNQEGMRLDLGGIAKGYAIGELYTFLEEHGIASALVDGGGDMMIGYPKPDGSSWSIRIEGRDQAFQLHQQAIACSGSTYQKLDHKGQSFSHIVDPKTGLGMQNLSSVCIVAKDAMVADALASTLSIVHEIDELILKYYEAHVVYMDETSIK